MTPTTNQTVPSSSFVPAQATDRKPVGSTSAPAPLDAEALRQISGGVSTDGPHGTW
jgi:hypothetical protein